MSEAELQGLSREVPRDFARLLRGSNGQQVAVRVDHNDNGDPVVKFTVQVVADVFADYAIGPFPDDKAFDVLAALTEPKSADAVLKELEPYAQSIREALDEEDQS